MRAFWFRSMRGCAASLLILCAAQARAQDGTVEEAARRFSRRITLNARPEYHIEQFDLQGK